MHLFRRKARSPSPSIEVPRLCLPRQKATTEAPSDDDDSMTMAPTAMTTARLNVPSGGRIRSSSFDSSSLKNEDKGSTLQLPISSQRSKSLDSSYVAGSTSEENTSDRDSTSSLRIPVMSRYYRRRSTDIPRLCIHCIHIESLSSQEPSPASSDGEITPFSVGDSTADLSLSLDSGDEDIELDNDSDASPLQSCGSSDGADCTDHGTGVLTLAVPLVKLRASSFDSSCISDSPILQAIAQERRGSLDMLDVPAPHARSSSVDVNLPTCTSNHYHAMSFFSKKSKK